MRRVTGLVTGFGAALAGAAGIAGVGLMVRNSLKGIDATAKFADRLGINIEKLTAYQFAAEQTGVKVETFNMALQRMTRRVSEAGQGTGEAKAAIKELGLSATVLAALPVDQQFARIADAMNRVQSQSERVRLSFKLFDSEGVALVNTLKLGSAGLAAMEKDARSLGIVFDRDAAAKVEKANDAMNRFKRSVGGVAQSIAIQLAPFLEHMANLMTQNVAGAAGNMGTVILNVFESISVGIAKTINLIKDMPAAFKELQGSFQSSFSAIQFNLANMFDAFDRQGFGGKGTSLFSEWSRDLRKMAGAGREAAAETKEIAAGMIDLDRVTGGDVRDFFKGLRESGAAALPGPLAVPGIPEGALAGGAAAPSPSAPQTIGALEKGTQAAFSRIQEIIRGGGNEQKEIALNTKLSVEQLKEIKATLRDLPKVIAVADFGVA